MSWKNVLTYAIVLIVFGTGVAAVLHWGETHERGPSEAVGNQPPADDHGPRNPLGVLLLQVIVILIAAKLVGILFRRLGQPEVVGEMVAGILLGPSLLGWLHPATFDFLFPRSSLPSLSLLSQVGIILFMFVVGIDLDVEHFRGKAEAVLLVSHVSIALPFFLGTVLSLFLFETPSATGGSNVSFSAFGLFMGVSMSVTAFPVLARILEERRMTSSRLGAISISCAAVDDVTAWCLLALVVAFVKAKGAMDAALTVALSLAFLALMLLAVRPMLRRFLRGCVVDGAPGRGHVAAVLVLVFTAALTTELIGIHALFGAFLAGVAMPRDPELRQALRKGLEAFSSVFLLPLFFAFTGLRTQVGLLEDWAGWLMCAVVIVVAIAGKLGGSALAARWTGMTWHDSLGLGVLMNTRGLVELIVLNAGLDLHILSPRIFAIMILMALGTTMMTGPLMSLLGSPFGGKATAR